MKRKYIDTSSWSSGCSVSCFWVFNSSTDFNKSLWVYSKARDCRISPWPQAKIVRKNVKELCIFHTSIYHFSNWLFTFISDSNKVCLKFHRIFKDLRIGSWKVTCTFEYAKNIFLKFIQSFVQSSIKSSLKYDFKN